MTWPWKYGYRQPQPPDDLPEDFSEDWDNGEDDEEDQKQCDLVVQRTSS